MIVNRHAEACTVFLDLKLKHGYNYHNCAEYNRRWIFINKHKFLAELGRLLTFMYEEDRLTALSMYERMFDETADEEGLLQLLISPTRQAVVLARSYDAKERKLQMQSRTADAEYAANVEDVPSFVFVIDKTAKQAEELGVKFPAVLDEQFSIFEEAAAAVEEIEALPVDAAAAVEPAADEALEAEELNSSVEETAAALDAFLADFSVENGELVSKAQAAEPGVEAEAESEAEAEVEVETEAEPELVAEVPVRPEEEEDMPPVYKTNIFLLILYIFLAIPVGLIGIVLLLIPAFIFLSLAAGCAITAVYLLSICFGSFAVIADAMVVFGAALGGIALALLFAWMFLWFLGGVISGFIRGLCKLGRKICCKEVAVQ